MARRGSSCKTINMKRYGQAGASCRTGIGSLVATAGVLLRTGKPSFAEAPQPVVAVVGSPWHRESNSVSIKLKILTKAEFPDYVMGLWNMPDGFSPERFRIETDAKEFLLAKNTDGEFHLILFFALQPNAELHITLWKR